MLVDTFEADAPERLSHSRANSLARGAPQEIVEVRLMPAASHALHEASVNCSAASFMSARNHSTAISSTVVQPWGDPAR